MPFRTVITLICLFCVVFLSTSVLGAQTVEERLAALESAVAIDRVSRLPVSFNALIEVEAAYEKSNGTDSTRSLELATVEWATSIAANDHLNGFVVLLYEEGGDQTVALDQGAIELSFTPWGKNKKLMVTVGQIYLPFGSNNSGMVSDPITLELGETDATTLLTSFGNEQSAIQAGLFKGSADPGGTSEIDSWVVAIDVAPYEGLALHASWLSDLAESGAELTQGNYHGPVPAVALAISWQLQTFNVDVEYLTALKPFSAGTLDPVADKKPAAWFAEVGYAPAEKWSLTARYEGAGNFSDAVRRYGAAASYGFYEYATVSLEYLHSSYPDMLARNTHGVTAQLAFEF